MATSKCVYPYPVLIVRDARTVEWRPFEEGSHRPFAGVMVPVTVDVRLSFYQIEGKPWDWSRARRLADACYAEHGAIAIEDPLGNVWLEGEQPPEHEKRRAGGPTKAGLIAALEALLPHVNPTAGVALDQARFLLAHAA